MTQTLTKEETISQIVKEAKKLDKLELQILLTKLRVKKLAKTGVKPSANPSQDMPFPTMEEINLWKHESRKQHAGK